MLEGAYSGVEGGWIGDDPLVDTEGDRVILRLFKLPRAFKVNR